MIKIFSHLYQLLYCSVYYYIVNILFSYHLLMAICINFTTHTYMRTHTCLSSIFMCLSSIICCFKFYLCHSYVRGHNQDWKGKDPAHADTFFSSGVISPFCSILVLQNVHLPWSFYFLTSFYDTTNCVYSRL